MDKIQFILGSQSPRRQQILKWIELPFRVVVSNADETDDEQDPIKFAEKITLKKAVSVRKQVGEIDRSLIMTADTIVLFNNDILGKPNNISEARETLIRLRGKSHEVITFVHFDFFNSGQSKEHGFHVKTKVTFNNFSDDVLESYLKTKDCMDKAGAYGLQGPGMVLVKHIEGSYSNVIGLPIDQVIDQLKKFLDVENIRWQDDFTNS